MRIPVLVYKCPTCLHNARIPYATEPMRCSCCNRVTCDKCTQVVYCPYCFQVLTPEEQLQVKRINTGLKRAGGGTGCGCMLIIMGVLPLFIGLTPYIFKDAEQSSSTVIALVAGIAILVLGCACFNRGNKGVQNKHQELNALKEQFDNIIRQRLNASANASTPVGITFSQGNPTSSMNPNLAKPNEVEEFAKLFLSGSNNPAPQFEVNLDDENPASPQPPANTEAATAGPVFCTRCGLQNESGSNFCARCGSGLL